MTHARRVLHALLPPARGRELTGVAMIGAVGAAAYSWCRSRSGEDAVPVGDGDPLAEAIERYRSLFEYHTQATFSLDLDGRFIAANRAAERVSGYDEEQLRAMARFTDLVVPEDREAADLTFDRALARQSVRVDLRIQHAAGHLVELSVTGLPILVGDEVVGVHGMAEDVTERNRLQRDLVRSEQSAVRANQAKSMFVANVSHEIRTPLTSMLAITELMADLELDEEGRRFVDVLHRSGHRLMRLVDDLLDFARIEAGVLTLHDAALDLRGVLHDAIGLVAVPAKEKGLSIELEVDPAIPTRLRGDGQRIGQVVGNLLGNAVKFTAAGTVRVTAQLNEDRAGVLSVLIRVSDTGIGMTVEEQARLFEPFSQADPTITRTYGGTGLGLAISKHLVQLMEGSIWMTSVPGRGSTFSVLLPLARD